MANNALPQIWQSIKRLITILFIFTLTTTFSSFTFAATADEPAYWFDVQTLEARDLVLSNFSGLGYLPEEKVFFSLDSSTGQIAVFTMRGDLQSISQSALAISNPLNLTYYPQSSDLVTLNESLELMTVGTDVVGSESLQAELLSEFKVIVGEIQNPQGLTYNPIDGSLYILDAIGPEIVKVATSEGTLTPRSSSKNAITATSHNDTNLEGLAFNPQDSLYYTYSPDTSTIYAVEETGTVISSFDLTELSINDFSGIVFAPSSDPTDDPTEMNLFLTDSGSEQTDAVVTEIDITETILPEEIINATLPATLVNIIDTSIWSPPSPDSAGLEYLVSEGQLMVVDSEVEEEGYWANANSFGATITGTLEETCDLMNKPGVLSKEPTGAAADPETGTRYVTDDNQRKIFIIELGPDGEFCTGDDITSSINTRNFGSGTEGEDPEGIAYGDGRLFVADGVGKQVYVLTPGPNGIFDGVSPQGDDLITDFDTEGLGLKDPEGIGYHWGRGTLFIVSRPDKFVVETTIDGTEVNRYSIDPFNIVSPAGLAIGPSSTEPGVMNVYISQRGIDNSQDPEENDGKIYEIDIGDDPSPIIDLSITKTDSKTEIRPGSTTSYTIVVTHNGPDGDLVTGASVQDIFPASLTNVSWTCAVSGGLPGSACGSASGTGDIDELISLADGGSATFSVTATVALSATGEIINTATVSAPSTIADLAPGNNSATDTTTVLESGAYCADDPDLVGCWPFEEGSGTVIYDDSGSYNDGTVIESPTWSPGWVDSYALDLNGTSQYGLIPDDSTLDLTTAVTMAAWIQPEQAAAQDLINKAQTGITDGYELSLAPTSGDGTSQKVFFRINEASNGDTYRVNSTSQYPTDGSWMHVVATFDGTTLRMYVNGTLENSISAAGQTIFANDASLSIGAQPSGGSAIRYFMGAIDDARIYNRALSDLEIQALFGNTPPTAVNDDYSIPENIQLIVDAPGVLGNDSDPDSDPITAVKETEPSNGTATLNPNGSFTYTPNPDYTGPDSFTYYASDGNLSGTTATINITVNNVNIPPDAQADSAITDEDAAVVVSVLDNDSDPDLDPLTITLVSDPANGSAAITNAGTTVTYTPDLNYIGLDSFTYTISDGQGGTDTASVTITVDPVNDPPNAVDDAASTPQDTPVVISVLDNDSDPDFNTLTVTLVSDPANGTAAITDAGTTITYTPDLSFKGPDSFTYTISDGQGGTDTATVTVSVNNQPPSAGDDTATTDEDTAAVITVLNNDSDPDLDTLTVTFVSDPTNGTAAITDANTTVTYTPDPNYHGSDSFSYTISDGQGGTDTAAVNVTVNPVNDPPTAVNDTYNTPEDTSLVVPVPGVLSNDTDPDTDPLTAIKVTDPAHGSLTFNSNGSFTYTPNLNYAGPDSFTYKANDGNLDSSISTVNLTVGAVNDPPTANNDSYNTDEDTPLVIASPGLLTNDTDPETNPLTAIKVTNPSNGSVALNANGSFTYTPNADFNGTDNFTYKANDGTNDSNIATVTVTVQPVNDFPEAVDDNPVTDEDTSVVVSVLSNDTDIDLNVLTIIQISEPANGTAVITNSGTTVTYTPNLNYNGPDSFTYTISDGKGGTDAATVSVTVNPVNDPPVAGNDSATTDEDTAVTVPVLTKVADVEQDSLSVTNVSDPANGSATITDAGTTVTYTPGLNYNGPDSFTYTISDGNGGTDTATVNITVIPVNDPPVAANDSDSTSQDTAVEISVLDNDTDVDSVTLTVTNVSDPANGSAVITNAGTSVTYTPDPFYSGPDSFNYTISDGDGATDTAEVNITVIGTIVDTAPPTISFVAPLTNGTLPLPRAYLIVIASDAETAVERVEFEAYLDGSWQPLGTDDDPADGWMYQWATGQVADRFVAVRATAFDFGGNSEPAVVADIEITSVISNGSGYEYRAGGNETLPAQETATDTPQTEIAPASLLPNSSPGMFINKTIYNWWKYLQY